MEAEKRILNDKERSTWLEARKRWDDAEKDYCNMLRQKSRIRIEKISSKDMRLLENSFDEKEVWDAVRGCGGINPRGTMVEDLIGLGDFRPISLIECYYKIIAKMLLERVKRVVEIVVGEEQNTFIKGRYILDGVLIANETLEFLKKKKEFRLERRVRQGDPLSPFFFILAADGLNAIANETVEKGIFRGVAIGENNITVSHLQYADYTILLGNEINRTPNLLCVSLNVLGSFRIWEGDEVWSDIVKIGEEIDGMGIKFSSSCVGVWALGGDGDFKVKELSSIIEEKILPSESGGQETLWNKLVPKKIFIFVWRALRGRLPVREELDRRGVDLDSVLCPSCSNIVETCVHSLITCDLAMSVWDKIFKWWKLGIVNAFSIDEFFSLNGNVNVPSYVSRIWQAVIWSIGYFKWKERNARVFIIKVSSTNKIVQDIQLKMLAVFLVK
ncbi:RNA-directed DNA polymerase, eukaryota, reverse transcriptase zinc-binding domain protein [Tanacetum coccineum]